MDESESQSKQSLSFSPTVDVLYFSRSSSSSSSLAPPRDVVLQRAIELVGREDWVDVEPPSAPQVIVAGRGYTYAVPPPSIARTSSLHHSTVKPFGDVSPDSEEPLHSFISTDFLSLLLPFIDLWTVIPHPHLLPTPHNIDHLPPEYPVQSSCRRKVSPYGRSSLFVPISGQPPFPGSSRARLIPRWPPPRNIEPVEEIRPACICWTPKTLLRFWHFLVKIQQKGNCGPIGLSYQPSHLAATRRTTGEDWAYIKVYFPSTVTEYLLAGLRNFPAGREEGRRKVLDGAMLGWLDDDASVGVG